MALQIKRIYDPPEQSDGLRLLVDRVWPRGVVKERAHLDEWIKEVTPSTELRKWFGHKAEKFDEFSKLYREELDSNPEAQEAIQKIIKQNKQGMVTLLYAAKDPQINHAVLLKAYIESRS